VTGGPAASQEPFDGRSTLNGRTAHKSARRGGRAPKARTHELIARELLLVRDQLDRYVATGRLALAGECCVELDQLLREMARLQEPRPNTHREPARDQQGGERGYAPSFRSGTHREKCLKRE
jgi:hypothetical protein